MGVGHLAHAVGLTAQVFFLDLLLSGDNALVIALACRGLPKPLLTRAVMLGTVLAIVLRVALTAFASVLLTLPLVKLLGAVALVSIALKLLLPDEDPAADAGHSGAGPDGLVSAIRIIVTADVLLSLDNVAALAAVTQGHLLLLALGVLLSVPLLMYGSLFVTRLVREYPLLVPAGSALLALIAGRLALSDALLASWVTEKAPALGVVVPVACAVFVLAEARIVQEQRNRLSGPLLVPAPQATSFGGRDGLVDGPPQPGAPDRSAGEGGDGLAQRSRTT
ncbi:MAG: YjbE family putative metal transport protein [Betaproteobacteria bacterium]|nr:YjbE family putative metal transport protein [Betaproteobacteria bacterium]